MDLKAEEVEKLQTVDYWESRYAKDNSEFDWFKTYKDLQVFLEDKVPKCAKIIMLGCGNSSLSAEMYSAGYKYITNVDFSKTVIQEMKEKYPEMDWIVADVRDLPFEDNSFDIAIDKGTLDALLAYKGSVWTLPDNIALNASQYMNQVYRVLNKPTSTFTSKFIYISYRQPHFASLVFKDKEKESLWEQVTYEELKTIDPNNNTGGILNYYGYSLIPKKKI